MYNEHYYKIIKRLYEIGGLNLKQIFDLTTQKKLNKEQFHYITSYNYDGIKENWGW